MIVRALLLGLLTTALAGQDLARLPEWARGPAAAALQEPVPAGADAWVLLERTEVTYAGDGELRTTLRRLVKVLGERGLDEGQLVVHSLGGKAEKVKRIRGWNLRPDGELVKLNRDDVGAVDADARGEVSTDYLTGARVARVAVGSLVAFETDLVSRKPMGPAERYWLAGAAPVRRWELAIKDANGATARIEPRHWAAWGLQPESLPGGGLATGGIAPVPQNEQAHPNGLNVEPLVELCFLDPGWSAAPSCASWDSLAAWVYGRYRPAIAPTAAIPRTAGTPVEALGGIVRWMARELTCKAIYLTPDRGWIPEPGAEVVRKRYGDCKDHAACFLGEAAGLGFEPFPVLCRILDGEVEPDQPPFPYAFNHAIAALRLKESLGLPAEVATPQGRFLLVDTTDRYCPFGFLPWAHQGRRVMICTPAGAIWTEVPASATPVPSLAIDLQGQVAASGAVTARVRLGETGNAQGLRFLLLEGGTRALREWLLGQGFHLPANGTLAELKAGDPLALDGPFEASFTLALPPGSALHGQTLDLESWGFPGIPGAVQKPGIPRRLPVAKEAGPSLRLRADWSFPWAVQPGLPEAKIDGPFRRLRWQARAEGTRVRVELDEDLPVAHFDGDRRAAGVAAWKEDREFMKRLHLTGTSYRKD